jgi:hypothetical protein
MAKLGPVAQEIADAAREAGRLLPGDDLRFAQSRLPLADGEALTLALDVLPTRALAVDAARRRGRPKGSRNRRSEELIGYLLKRYAHPLEVLVQMASRPTHALAAELKCDEVQALAIQKSAAAEALPYFESKKPVAVQVDNRVIQLTIHEAAPGGPREPDAIDGENVALAIMQAVGNQEVSER